jgi:hypothetical protein
MANNWWGDWRPSLPVHTGNLQPTDLIECTSIVGGLPVNTAITGSQIIAAASGGSAVWGGITGTLSAQTDLQAVLDNKVPYTGATADVNLGSHDLTATQGTFATGGSSDTLTVNHTSGSGKAITITKGGAGEGIYVDKTSGSGNAVTIVGDLEATTIKKTSGTSTQFLKADGSVDTTTYQPTLVSGTNIKTINSTSLLGSGDISLPTNKLAVGTNVTGTTAITISANSLLPANTLVVGKPCMIHLKARGRRVSGTNAVIACGMYRNTSVSTTGYTFLGQMQMGATNTLGHIERHLFWDGVANISVQFPATGVSDMISNGTFTTTVINPAVNNYFLFTVQCANALDTGQIQWGLYILYT